MDKTCEHCWYWRHEVDDLCCCEESPNYGYETEEGETCKYFLEDRDG